MQKKLTLLNTAGCNRCLMQDTEKQTNKMLIVRFALNRQVFSLAYSFKTETAENSLASHFEGNSPRHF